MRKQATNRFLSMLLVLAMVLGMMPMNALAVEAGDASVCAHHTEHTADCGYAEAVAGADCTHVHDEDCGSDCTHEHDDTCGYVAAVAGADCTYECAICPVQAMMDALSTAVPTSEEEYAALEAAILAVDAAMAELTSEQAEQLDYTNYVAATVALAAYAGEDYSQEELAEADGWYWDDTTLYIKDGSITKGKLYNALVEKYGSGSYKYAASKPSLGWDAGGTEVTSGDTASITVNSGSAAAGKKGSTSYKDWTGWGANSSTNTFTVEYYYNPTVTETANPTSTKATVTGKVFYGKNATVTLPQMSENGWVAKVSTGTDTDSQISTQTVKLSTTGTTAVTVGPINSVADATIAVVYEKAESYSVTVNVADDCEGWGTASASATSSIAGETITITATPTANTVAATYAFSKLTVNGVEQTHLTFTMPEKAVEVVVYFTKTGLEANESATGVKYNGYYADGTQMSTDALNALKEAIFNGLAVQSLPTGATWDNVTYQYFPWYTTAASGSDYSDEDSLTDLNATNADFSVDIPLVGTVGYTFSEFGQRGFTNGAFTGCTEKVRISYTIDGTTYYVDGYVTLTEARENYTLNKPEKMSVTFEEQTDIDNAVLTALQNANAGQTITVAIVDGQTLPTGGNTANLTYNVTVAANAAHLGCTDTVTIAATAKSNPANITFATGEGSKGSGSVNFGGLTANGTLAAGTYTLTVTPSDLEGSDGSAMYVDSVTVNGTAVTGTYSGGIFTASVTVANDNDYTITVTYGTRALDLNESPVVKINGNDWSTKANNLKNNFIYGVLNTVSGVVTDYTVYVRVDLWVSNDYQNLDDDVWTSDLIGSAIQVPGTEDVKIQWNASSDGKYVAVYKEGITVTVKEAREAATVTPPSALSGTFDTKEAFLDALKNATIAYDNNNAKITEDVLTLTPSWNGNVCTVTWEVTADGETWLKASGNLGTYTWNISTYTVTWYNEDGTTVLDTQTLAYGSTPEYKGTTTTADLAAAKNDAQYTWAFDKWVTNDKVAEDGTITGAATYTASYTNTTNKYQVIFKDHDGTELQNSEWDYGATPVYSGTDTDTLAANRYTAQYTYTFAGWSPEIATVTGVATYTATYTSAVNKYTITFVNGDGSKTEVEYEYGATPEAPEIIAKPDDKDATTGNTTYYYTDGTWGDIATVTGDATYTATFTKNAKEYTITWNWNDGYPGSLYLVYSATYGEKVEVAVSPGRTGYSFAGFTSSVSGHSITYVEDASRNYCEFTMPAADLTITATWTIKTYKYKVETYIMGLDGQYALDKTETLSAEYNTTVSTVPAGKTGFTVADDSVRSGTIPANNSLVLKVYYSRNQYTVTYLNDDGTELNKVTYYYGAEIAEYIPTKTDYTFGGWGEGVIVAETMPANDLTYTVVWTQNPVITWNVDGVETKSNFSAGTTVTLPTTPTKVGYTFAGWQVGNEVYTEGWTMGSEDVTATATWTINKHTVTWNVDGKKTEVDYEYNATIVAPASPTKTGYTFTGWDGYTANMKMGDADVTFTAKWQIDQYTITFDTDGGSEIEAITQDYDTAVTAPANPTKTGYTFTGWDMEVPTTMPAGNVTIKATWTINQYTVTFVDHDGTEIAKLTQDYATAITAPADPTRTGYTFKGWDKEIPSTMPAEDMTITATYEINKYTVTWIVDGVETEEGYEYGATPSFKGSTDKAADAQYTYTFTGWDMTVADVTADAQYTAQYSKTVNTYTVTWSVDGNETSEEYTYGDTPSFKGSTDKATVNSVKYTFTGWDNTVSTVVADVTYTAQYSAEFLATNSTVEINKYYTGKMDSAALATLRTDILTAAGLDPQNSSFVVTAIVGIQSLGDWATWTVEVKDGDAQVVSGQSWMYQQGYLASELDKSSYTFTITESVSGMSKEVTMQMVDSRPSAGLVDTEITDVKVLNDELGLTDYVTGLANDTAVNPNGLTVTVALTEGSWPPAAAGVTTKLVYTVTYADSAAYIGGTAALTVYVQSAYNNCTVTAGSIGGGTLTVSPSNDNKTVAGNDTVSVTITPASGYAVESVTVYNQTTGVYVDVSEISYSNKAATVTFKSDGSLYADQYVVSATYSEIKLTLNADQTIVYCIDDINHTYDLKKLVFDAVYGSFNIDLTKDDVTLEFKYGTIVVDLWADVSGDPAINLNGISHKFGESGLETIRFTYEDDKYGEVQQTIDLNVFDSCYNNTVGVETIAPAGTKHDFSVKYSEDAREYLGVSYYKQGTTLTVRLTPSGDDILAMLEQMYNKTYADNYPYIKSVTVYKNVDGAWVEMESTLERVNGEVLQGENPLAYCAAVTFTMDHDTQYKIVAEYDILKLNRVSENKFQMEMYQAGKGYEAKVPSAQDFINKMLGEEAAAEFLTTYGGSYKVEFSSDLITYNWTEVTDAALLALNDGTEIVVRITWTPADDNKTYYPMSVTAEPTLVDLRTATSVEGTVPTEAVEYIEEDQLIANLKEAMDLAIITANGAIDVEYDVNYTITVSEVNGNYATVIVTYHGSTEYKPCTKTFENVPVADMPDNATIKVTIQNASDRITNNAGTIMSLDPSTGIYTVVGNGTYHFQFTPVSGKAIEAVTVNGEAVELTYSKGVATFSMYLNEKVDYEVVVETVDSVFVPHDDITTEDVIEGDPQYDFAFGVMEPTHIGIAEAALNHKLPVDMDPNCITVEYLARAEGTVTITLPSFTILGKNVELGTFDVELGKLWLDLDEGTEVVSEDQLDKILEKLLEDLQDEILSGNVALTDALDYVTNYVRKLPLGIHAFGANGDGSTETVKITYDESKATMLMDDEAPQYVYGKYTHKEIIATIIIHDYRTKTELTASDCEVTYGYSLSDLIAASGAEILADSEVINVAIETEDLYKTVGEHEITLFFAGDKTYQPCEVTINVTVNKAVVSIDYDSQIITYGDEYEFGISIAPGKHNDGTAVDPDMVEFMIGLDASKLLDVDIEDKTVGLNQAVGTIFIRLPKSVREILTSDLAQALGITALLENEMSLSQASELINTASSLLGIDEESVDILNQVITAITGITDSVDVKVQIVNGDFHPTNIGVYIAGAVTIEENYETAYTADYLIIIPATQEHVLTWDHTDENGILTLPAYDPSMLYASRDEDCDDCEVKYLILGINDDTSEFLTTDVYGNIKANIYVDPNQVTDNGAYVEIAYVVAWGNTVHYAVPIVRTFVILPQTASVTLLGQAGTENSDLLKEFNNQPQNFHVKVEDMDGNLILNTYANTGMDKTEWLTVTYVGVQTNGQPYNSTKAPIHSGTYAVVATYIEYDDNGELLRAGVDTGVLVIEPTTSTIEVGNSFIKHEDRTAAVHNLYETLGIKVGSTVENLTPDVTIITGSIATAGDFSENGWDAIAGNVNVDFPDWMDEFLSEHAPDVMTSGITVGTLNEKLTSRVDSYAATLAELGATEEIVNSFKNLIASVTDTLAKMPEDVKLTFNATEDLIAEGIGAYVVVGVVTDSDHYPSVDAGIMVLYPDVDQVFLKWNYEDTNGVFTPELLQYVDLYAQAYNDEECTVLYTDKDANITYQFIGIDLNGDLIVKEVDDASIENLDEEIVKNGAYIEMAYVKFEIAGEMVISNLIARPVVIIPNTVDVEIVVDGAEVADNYTTTFDNASVKVEFQVSYEGTIVNPSVDDLTIKYYGIQSNGKVYESSTIAPKHAGVYTITATYTEKDAEGNLIALGADIATLVIKPAEATIEVEDVGAVPYDANAHTIQVEAKPVGDYSVTIDTTKISIAVSTDGTFSEIGLDAAIGNVNVDFPKWVDTLFAEQNILAAGYTESGIDVSVFAGYIENLKALMEENGMSSDALDSIAGVIELLPDDVTLTFHDDVEFTNVGAYLMIGIVTDSDHLPAVDTGYMVIHPTAVDTELEFNYNDENGIFTNELMKYVDMGATAYVDETHALADADTATSLINHIFFGMDEEGNVVLELMSAEDGKTMLSDVYGVFTQISFIAHVDSVIYVAAPIARPIIRTPDMVIVDFDSVVETYNGLPIGIGDITVTDMAGNVVDQTNALTIYYAGISTNGKMHTSTDKPVHAGVYTVTVIYNKDGKVGAGVGTLTILPAKAEITVPSLVVMAGEKYEINVDITSADVDENADVAKYLLMTAGINTVDSEGKLSLSSINTINLDFPAMVDTVLDKYIENDDVTVGDFVALADKIESALTNAGISSEYLDQALTVLKQLGSGVTVTFYDNYKPADVGIYFLIGTIFDPDYLPAADAGILAIYPDADLVDIEFNEEIPGFLNFMPYEDVAEFDFGANVDVEGAESLLKNVIFGINTDLKLFIGNGNEGEKPYELGVYDQLAFLWDTNLIDSNKLYLAVPELRLFTVVKCDYDVKFVDETGAENADRLFTYDGTAKSMTAIMVDADGNKLAYEPVVYYMGINTMLEPTWSTTAPTDAGSYTVLAYYYNEAENIYDHALGKMFIQKADITFEMKDTTETYDGTEKFSDMVEAMVNPEQADALYVIIDRERNVANLVLEDDLNAVVDAIKSALGYVEAQTLAFRASTTAFSVTAEKLKTALNEVLANAAELSEQLPVIAGGIESVLAKVKTVVSELADDYTVTINGEMPVQTGSYNIYAVSYSANFYPAVTSGVLTIEPIEIEVTVADIEKCFHVEENNFGYAITKGALLDGDVLTVEYSVEDDNTIAAVVTGAEYYEITVVNGTLTLKGEEVVDKAVASTCTETGLTEGSHCSSCGETLVAQEVVDALDHSWGEADYTDNGDGTHTATYVCDNDSTHTKSDEAVEHTYEDGECVCGAVEEVISPIAFASAALLFKDDIQIKYYLTVENATESTLTNAGVEVWSAEDYNAENLGTPTVTYAGLEKNGSRYQVVTDGIAAKNMGDLTYARAYIDIDGVRYYSKIVKYSPAIYCKNTIARAEQNPTNEQYQYMKALCVALMNYGAAAQIYFAETSDYTYTTLMNEFLSEEQRAWVYDATKAVGLKDMPEYDWEVADTSYIKLVSGSVVTTGALKTKLYAKVNSSLAVSGTVGMLYWTEADVVNGKLSLENARNMSDVGLNAGGVNYQGYITDIAAKNLGDTVYMCAYVTDADGNTFYTKVVAYSAHQYSVNMINSSSSPTSMKDLAKTLIIYSDAAKEYLSRYN